MNNKVYIGKIVSTHGIKGELRIISDFEYKDKAFKVGTYLIIDDEKYLIKSYRKHKNYDMVTLNDFKDINEVLYLLKKKVYKLEEELNLNDQEILDSELMTYRVIDKNKNCGIIKDISKKDKKVEVELIDGMM